jgi:hypothetical protein
MSSLPKGESMSIKLLELVANRVVERRNMINDYLKGRACIERVRGSWYQGGVLILSFCVDFELFLLIWALSSSSLPFCLALPFSCSLLAFVVFPLLDDLIELFLPFGVF